jgi:hypothetical protein
MDLSREAKLVSGVTLLVVPSVMYGGIAILGILTQGAAGMWSGRVLDEVQWSLWRAGHAHAGVWLILALVIQIMLDSAKLPAAMVWLARIAAPLAALLVAGGFFGLAFEPGFQWLLYAGGLSLLISLVLAAVGLLRNLRPHELPGR